MKLCFEFGTLWNTFRTAEKMRVSLVAIILTVFQSSRSEAFSLVETISDYSKVVKNVENPTTIATKNESISTSQLPETSTEPTFDYPDFDDLQEEDRSLKQTSSTKTMMKYFNGLVSLLALMYKFNGSFGGTSTKLRKKNQNEPRGKSIAKEINKLQTENYFHAAQDRFEFPQKKFRYHSNGNEKMTDQQFQPVENYPPYNPLKANIAETYNQDDQKTSYDADIMQYDLTKNSINDYSPDVDIQQSYSYEIPYENTKPAKSPTYDLVNDDASWNNHNYHPIHQPLMMQNPKQDKPSNDENSYQMWNTKDPTNDVPSHNEDSYKPWNTKTPDLKPQSPDSESRQPWNEKPLDFPIYHYDFKDGPPKDHHFDYHEIEHPVDEDRVSKKPYSYYFLGRKLWYIPLLFSVYFIIYIGALVLKSVARHKIQFPEKIWDLHDEHFSHGKHRRHRKIDEITENYEKAVEKMTNKFM